MMIVIKCPLKPTENAKKVKEALSSFFSANFKIKKGAIESKISESAFKEACEGSNSIAFSELLKNKKIKISKMALLAGKINIEDEHPLGSVEIALE